jgi:hypothetical protein
MKTKTAKQRARPPASPAAKLWQLRLYVMDSDAQIADGVRKPEEVLRKPSQRPLSHHGD